MAPLLKIEDLEVNFTTPGGDVPAVRGLSLSVERHQVLGVVGESGSGKTVTMLAVLGLLRPPGRVVRGRALFDGQDLLRLDQKQMRSLRGARLSMIFQNPTTSLNPVMSVGAQIDESLRIGADHRDAATRRERTIDLLRLVGVPSPEQRLRAYPHEMSGGMCQRVMIAIALARDPDLLVADEPTTALDVTVQAQILRLLDELRQRTGLSMIYITHDLHIAAQFCDEVAVMYAGQVLEQGPARQVLTHPTHPYTEGLVGSVPSGHWREARLKAIPGQPLSPSAHDIGCPFAPRCPYVEERNRTEMPPWVTTGPNQQARCFRWT
jgi:oligopeptide/dipeptide ABC transporter ATP-binding protein